MATKKKAPVKKKSLFDKIKGVDTLKNTSRLSDSKFFVDEFYDTHIPALNIALSGRLDGGFSRGSTVIAGDSKTFKSMFMLVMAKAFMDECTARGEESIFVYYDVEFGTNAGSIESIGIDADMVMHKPVTTVEQLKIDMVQLLEEVDEKDNVFIGIDSLGAIASKKELEDAIAGKSVGDMSRAKAIKSFWRTINPALNVKRIPMVAIGQTYDTQEMYAKAVIGGGKGMVYFPNNIWMITKTVIKNKTTKEVEGNFFNVTVYKGRLTKEGAKFPIEITHGAGIDKYSSLLDIALKLGYATKPKIGWFTREGLGRNVRRADTSTAEFWDPVLANPDFKKDIKDMFTLGSLREMELKQVSVYEEGELEEEKSTVREYKMSKKTQVIEEDNSFDINE